MKFVTMNTDTLPFSWLLCLILHSIFDKHSYPQFALSFNTQHSIWVGLTKIHLDLQHYTLQRLRIKIIHNLSSLNSCLNAYLWFPWCMYMRKLPLFSIFGFFCFWAFPNKKVICRLGYGFLKSVIYRWNSRTIQLYLKKTQQWNHPFMFCKNVQIQLIWLVEWEILTFYWTIKSKV